MLVALIIGGIGGVALIYVSGHLGSSNQVYTIPQTEVNTAVSQVANNPNWCLGNALVTVGDYRPGDTINEVIVLHNGNDAIGSFTVQSQSSYINLIDPNPPVTTTSTTTTDMPTVNNTSLSDISLQPMETRVVKLAFKIPPKTSFSTGYTFMVDVNRTASTDQMIVTAYQQKWKVY